MNPRSLFAIALAAAGLGLALTPARADDTAPPPPPPADTVSGPPVDVGPPPPPPPGGRRRGGGGAGYILADLTQKLTLTPDQQKTVGGFIASARQQGRAVREDTTLSKEDRRSKMMAILQTTKGEIRGVLTPDQQKIFDTLRPARRGPGAPPPAEPGAPVAPVTPTPTMPPTT